MPGISRIVMSFMIMLLAAACGTSITALSPTASPAASPTLEPMPQVSISRHPQPAVFSGHNLYIEPPVYDPSSSSAGWQVDLRSSDLTKLDLSNSISDLLFADFDSQTQWPPSDKMPANFDWQKIMEVNKDPGLGVRALHDRGITGRNVGIAIIDQTLLVDHIEYVDRLRLYEEPERRDRGMAARMHGPAVASIAVGKTVGVAPEADLYYIAASLCFQNNDFACLARSVRRIIEINKALPASRKIRVLSISRGWGFDELGYADIMAAVREASAEGIFVISSSLSQTHNLNFHGLGRAPLSDPNDFWSYAPGLWWQDYFYLDGFPSPTLLAPMDSRTTASPTGTDDYVFYRQGGWSWSIPYLAGVYALAVQVDREVTPEEFWETALSTGQTIHIEHNGKDFEFGVILDPQTLIEKIKNN